MINGSRWRLVRPSVGSVRRAADLATVGELPFCPPTSEMLLLSFKSIIKQLSLPFTLSVRFKRLPLKACAESGANKCKTKTLAIRTFTTQLSETC